MGVGRNRKSALLTLTQMQPGKTESQAFIVLLRTALSGNNVAVRAIKPTT